jgi:26S proteasome regulatory subunit N1
VCPVDGRQPQGAALDSARQNLASTFVNAFVNAGYGQDKLVTVSTEGQSDSGWCTLWQLYIQLAL